MSKIDFSRKMSFQRPFSKPKKIIDDNYAIIRQFESDRGRIINSAAIRRLQQKTQVFPLERNAAVRSRLTHSLEVQQVGRHIVKDIIDKLEQRGLLEQYGMRDYLVPIESVVEMACLLHDVGNPPFGHFGEDAINRWFREFLAPDYCDQPEEDEEDKDPCKIGILRLDGKDTELDNLRDQIRRDLCQFEGNAQSVRLVHSLQKLNLTYTQVACILKYTRPAYWTKNLPADYNYLMNKPGYYLSEEPFIVKLREQLDIQVNHRHPLTYIMEAADDISYCIADLEDAVEKDIFTVEQLYAYLQSAWGESEPGDLFQKTVEKANQQMLSGSNRRSASDQFFMYLRVYTIGSLVSYAAQRFIRHLPSIFDGDFNQALLGDESEQCRLLNIFKEVAFKKVFNYAEVELLELQGDRVISGLLEIYSPLLHMPPEDFRLLVRDNASKKYKRETRLWHKLSVKQRLAYEEAVSEPQNSVQPLSQQQRDVWEFYYRARLIQDYISGMTDHYAYDEYRRLMAAE